MPIHDWSRVDPNVFHHFHQRWTIAISDALNAGLVPPGYSALVEPHAGGLVPDVLAVQRRARPAAPAGGVLMDTPPKTRHVFSIEESLAGRGNRIAIRHRLGEVVCVIEVVSPGNKGSKSALRSFVEKAVDLLHNGVNLLVVDLFPPTARDPQGIHGAINDEFRDEPFTLPRDKPLTLAAYSAADLLAYSPTMAYVEPVAVGDVMPDMPAYLNGREYVPVPLENSYQAAWATCPADMRELVETGRLSDDE